MPPSPGDEASAPEPSRAGGLANVFKGLTGAKLSSKSPPPSLQSTSSVALPPMLDHMAATSGANPSALSTNHKEAIVLLKNGPTHERIAAADSLRHVISEYPLSPVLEVWDAARDLIDPEKSASARNAGWELLTECVKHKSSTDLERKDFFDTLTAHTNPDDFHLQLAALIDLTRHGRDLSGFDYDVIPLLRKWLRDIYQVVKAARKQASREAKKNHTKTKPSATAEEKNLQHLFAFIVEVIKFSSNVADETALSSLVQGLVTICLDTNSEQDLRACIGVIDAIVTFGALPTESFRECVLVIGSIFCLVPSLHKPAWHTLSMILKSHNGHATVRVLLDLLRGLPGNGSSKGKDTRNIRGVLAVTEKLLTKSAEKGYPTIPFTLLMEGLGATVHGTSSVRVQCGVLTLINSLFDDGHGKLHPMIVEEDWSAPLAIASECARRATATMSGDGDSASIDSDSDRPFEAIRAEIVRLITRLVSLMTTKTAEFIPRQVVVKFLTDVHILLPDTAACVVLEFFQEFRCCSPSDLLWEANLGLVRREFFANRNRSSRVRMLALRSITEAYEMLDLVGEHMEKDAVPKLIKDTLADVSEETDVQLLEALVAFMVDVAVASDLSLFNIITSTLKSVIGNDRLRPPVSQTPSNSTTPTFDESEPEQTASGIVTKGYIKLFMRCMDFSAAKCSRLFDLLVSIAKASHCTTDARLTAMKFLFRLRADWGGSIFLTLDTDSDGLAASLFRTEASLARKQAGDSAFQTRSARPDLGPTVRSSRGVSFSHAGPQDRAIAARSLSGAKQNSPQYRQQWALPDPNALPFPPSAIASLVLVSHAQGGSQFLSNADEPARSDEQVQATPLNLASWLETIVHILEKGGDWEVTSMVLVHLPSQLSNHAIFRGAIPQMQSLRRIVCEQIRTNSFHEAPISTGLRRADVAICLFHSLTMILSYHAHFLKDQEDEIVRAFVHGISTWERCAKYCIHALSICCHELPLSTSKCLVQMLQKMTLIITQPHVAMHILEFLAGLSRLSNLYVNFREEEYRIVFGISIRYLQYVRDKRQFQKAPDSAGSTPTTTEAHGGVSDDLPQYVYALAHHVITYWFLALKLQDRANIVGWLSKALVADVDGVQNLEEQALVTIDFMQRVTYADANESAADILFTEERFGEIQKRRWLSGNSIVTIEQATATGWAQITKRQASGTSSYMVREAFKPPPLHQTQHIAETGRENGMDNRVLPSHLMVQLMTSSPQFSEAQRPIALPQEDAIDRAIRVFDRAPTVDGHKVGVIYIGEGQTDEREILANISGSADYVHFLNGLGTLSKLKGSKINMQGLDREYGTDGQYTFCWRDRVTEIVFHVTTQMPTDLERDAYCIAKKRHIGNDYVNIVFNDSGLPFKFDTFPSEFNYVNIVITPESRASFVASRETPPSDKEETMPFYRVQLLSKPGFPIISPASETKMVSLKALPGFIRLLALNASVFSTVWQNREGGDTVSSWRNRLREIKRLREKYAPKASTPHAQFGPGHGHPTGGVNPSPPSTSLGGGHHGGTLGGTTHFPGTLADPGRPASSVRDSFGSSLRRSSVATFFTSTSEQTSHRSSVMSTSTTTNDTEIVPPNPADSLAEAVDFSKWA
ncbi:tuberin [Plectosphaerella plurivora]|uniref:Tuberin n=1 Tax=Plectosphaerella plurivora TaxID=936078 RepID=A0A9P8VFU5_9PEZI|nr:tuberin [Plectosphaerella plurivora]